jgi:glutathione S-transferase
MKPVRLYSAPLSMFGMKAHLAALEKGLNVDVVMVPFTDDHRYHPKHPDVERINPKGQVPALIEGDVEIFDSTQIFEYLEDRAPKPALWPVARAARAEARLLELKSDEVFFPHVICLMGLQHALQDPAAIAACKAASAYYLEMEARLASGIWLAGSYSYADIAFFMAQLFAERLGAPMTDATPNLLAWRARMMQRPMVRRVVQPAIDYLEATCSPVPGFLRSYRGGRRGRMALST